MRFKVGAVILKDRKFMMVKDRGQKFFKLPGGKADGDETDDECLKRELMEELSVESTLNDFIGSDMGTTGKGDPLLIKFYMADIFGDIKLEGQIEKIMFFNSFYDGFELVSNVKTFLIPKLIEMDLID